MKHFYRYFVALIIVFTATSVFVAVESGPAGLQIFGFGVGIALVVLLVVLLYLLPLFFISRRQRKKQLEQLGEAQTEARFFTCWNCDRLLGHIVGQEDYSLSLHFDPHVHFCPFCGKAGRSTQVCHVITCQADVRAGAQFCQTCGAEAAPQWHLKPHYEADAATVPRLARNHTGPTTCPTCQESTLQPEDKFCGACGAEKTLLISCQACGEDLLHNSHFCHHCGQAVFGATPSPSSAPVDWYPVAEPPVSGVAPNASVVQTAPSSSGTNRNTGPPSWRYALVTGLILATALTVYGWIQQLPVRGSIGSTEVAGAALGFGVNLVIWFFVSWGVIAAIRKLGRR